jgi:NAD(P)-dependent dehydrogenase (short-subunit alcohol dehydrogenase family)
MRMKDGVVIVTGASGNLGAAMSMRLAEEGAHVILTDVNGEAVGALAETILGKSHKATPAILDVTDEQAWRDLIARTESDIGSLTVLVNNAGLLTNKPIEDVTADDLALIFSVNVNGVFFGVREAVKAMRVSGTSGSIVNISSLGE